MTEKKLHFQSPRTLHALYCGNEDNLKMVEKHLGVTLATRDDWLLVTGEEVPVGKTELFFDILNKGRSQGLNIRQGDSENTLNGVADGKEGELARLCSSDSHVFQFSSSSGKVW